MNSNNTVSSLVLKLNNMGEMWEETIVITLDASFDVNEVSGSGSDISKVNFLLLLPNTNILTGSLT